MSTLHKLRHYADTRKILIPVSMVLSALSALTGLLAYLFIWLIVRELFESSGLSANEKVLHYAG